MTFYKTICSPWHLNIFTAKKGRAVHSGKTLGFETQQACDFIMSKDQTTIPFNPSVWSDDSKQLYYLLLLLFWSPF